MTDKQKEMKGKSRIELKIKGVTEGRKSSGKKWEHGSQGGKKQRDRKVYRKLETEMEIENVTDVSESVVKMSNFTLYLYEYRCLCKLTNTATPSISNTVRLHSIYSKLSTYVQQ